MILERIVADVFSENCYVLASGRGTTAIVVDPGSGTAAAVQEVLRAHDLTLDCVLLTHGHPDHVWDAAEVAGDAPVHVPAPDLYRLEDPLAATSPEVAAMLGLGAWRRPAEVRSLASGFFTGGGAELAGIPIRAMPAPGHTEGSTVYFLHGEWLETVAGWVGGSPGGAHPLALTGDVVFRGSVGRVDLPGGDAGVMAWTLRTLTQVVDPHTWLLPGHGPGSTMAHELATNPFLASRR